MKRLLLLAGALLLFGACGQNFDQPATDQPAFDSVVEYNFSGDEGVEDLISNDEGYLGDLYRLHSDIQNGRTVTCQRLVSLLPKNRQYNDYRLYYSFYPDSNEVIGLAFSYAYADSTGALEALLRWQAEEGYKDEWIFGCLYYFYTKHPDRMAASLSYLPKDQCRNYSSWFAKLDARLKGHPDFDAAVVEILNIWDEERKTE